MVILNFNTQQAQTLKKLVDIAKGEYLQQAFWKGMRRSNEDASEEYRKAQSEVENVELVLNTAK